MKGELGRSERGPSLRIILVIAIAGVAVGLPGYGARRTLGGVVIPASPFFRLAPEVATEHGGPDFTLDDRWNQAVTWFDYNGRTVCEGRVPTWNRNELGGSTYLAVGSTSALSPFLVASCPFPRGHRFFVATLLEFYVAAFGMFAFLRRGLRLSNEAAGLGAVGFALSGIAVAYALFPHGFTGSWIGLLALLALLIRRSRDTPEVLKWGLFFALVVALCGLSGQPEMLPITVGGAVVAAYLVRAPRNGSPRRALAALGGFSLAGAALAGAQLLPTALYSLSSALAQSRHAPTPWSILAPRTVLQGTKEFVAGMLLGSVEPGLQGPPGPGPTLTSVLPWSRITVYAGSALFVASIVILIMLAFGRISATWRPMARSMHIRFLVAAVLFSLVALKFPVTQLLISRLPIVSQVDVNLIRWVAVFFFAVLAALAFETIAARGFGRLFLAVLMSVNLLSAVVTLLLGRGLATGKIQFSSSALSPSNAQWRGLLAQSWRTHLAVAFLALLFLGIPRLHRWAPSAAMALVALEMVGTQGGMVNRWAEVYPVVDTTRSQLSQVRQSGQRIIGLGTLNPTLGTLLDVPALSGYTVMSDSHVALAESTESCKTYVAPVLLELCSYPPSPRSIGEYGNVGWVLGPKGLDSPELTASAKIGDFTLYRSTIGLGQAFFVRGASCEDYRRTQVKDLDASMKLDDPVSVNREGTNSLSISFAQVPQRRCLFVSESYAEGWTAQSARAKPRQVSPFAGVWQAVDVAAGDDTIRLAYEPPGYPAGLRLSLIAMLSLVLLAGWRMTRAFIITRSLD